MWTNERNLLVALEMNFALNSLYSGQLAFAWVITVAVLTAIVHIGFALAVLIDTGLMRRHLRRRTVLVGAGLWALAALLGGVWVAAVYWLLHHSTLFPSSAQTPSQS